MGAEQFETRVSAKTAVEAFAKATERARYDHGHAGYTGTIAEKDEFKMVSPRASETPLECVARCSSDESHFSEDKWGPAACVDLGADEKNPGHNIFIFFGWASS